MTYWDPIPTLRASVGEPLPLWRGDLVSRDWSLPAPDGWERRDWRSVPGPLYAANTDTCLTGRQCAPGLVMYEDEYGSEFLYRQPRNPTEVHHFICAADCEPFGGYGGDGDLHWTPELVRDWWRERGRVREWAVVQGWGAGAEDAWALGGNDAGARAYAAHIDRDLADCLRGYLFRLQDGRAPRPGETLPEL